MDGEGLKQTGVHTLHGAPDNQKKLLSSLRLKIILTTFVVLLLVSLSGLIFFLVSGIFSRLTPSMRADLEWKAQRGALELAQTADLGIALSDRLLIDKAFEDYRQSPDIMALVAVDMKGTVLASYDHAPEPNQKLFSGPPGEVRSGRNYLVAWANSIIEGNTVGRIAVVVKTQRLEAGERLRRHILGVAGIGCILALGISLFFVNFYLVPLINLTQQGLRTAREMEIAKRIQTSILPRRMKVESLDIAASMIPATEVGGDYYDVLPAEQGCWIGIGDVAGHGVQAGLVMIMVQSVVSALVRRQPDATPKTILETLNEVLFENIRHRIGSDEHVTFSLMRYYPNGQVLFSGAHEEIIVRRKRTGRCERIQTRGPWLGAVRSVAKGLTDDSFKLEPGDVLVLHTDGITEASNTSGEQFGIERLCAEVERHPSAHPDEIRKSLMDAVTWFMGVQDDDMTLLVVEYTGQGSRRS